MQDILFKFALDTRGIYGRNNAAAATVAGHELKGLQAYFDCGLHDVAVPLMALVDYRGMPLTYTYVLDTFYSTRHVTSV